MAASDALISSLAAQHAAAVDDLRRTRELLADAERPPTPVPAAVQVKAVSTEKTAVPATAAPAADTALGGAHVPGAPPAPAGASGKPDAGARPLQPKPGEGSFDELAFLQSVVDVSGAERTAPAPKPQPGTAPPRPAASPPTAPNAPGAPQRREPFVARKPEPRPEDRIQKQGESAAPLIQPRPGNRSSLAANISGNNPIVLKDKPNESAKTLKCAECGAMNYPTEWYCERCGAELASL